MIIWGWRVVRTVVATGRFWCPRCGCDSDYRHLALRRWFTLFFIPVIPLARLGRCVECTRCRGAFTERVLATATTEVFEHLQGLAVRAAVAHLLVAAAPAGDDERGRAVALLTSSPGVGPGYDPVALAADLAAFADPQVVAQHLHPLAKEMTVEGRERFLARLAGLAATLERRGPATDAVLVHVGAALGLSAAHVAGIRETVGGVAPIPGEDR